MTRQQRSVLIVDDDDDIRSNIQDILEDLGYQTDTAANGALALDLVRESTYDVALLDYKMPGIDGVTLYREIKRLRPEMVSIMITAYAGSHGAQEATDAGTWRVLRKPVNLNELIPLIDQATEQPIILVVDDDKDFCGGLWELLRDAGYRVNLAFSESDGLEKAESADYDIALVDLRLGGGDGRKVVDAIGQKRPHVRTIIVTGQHDHAGELMEDLRKQGVLGICFKPVEIDELLEMLG